MASLTRNPERKVVIQTWNSLKSLAYRHFGPGRNKAEYEFELDSKMVAGLFLLKNLIMK